MKVRAKTNLFESDMLIPMGSVFEVTEERARALGKVVEILEEETRGLESPPEDRAVKRTRKK